MVMIKKVMILIAVCVIFSVNIAKGSEIKYLSVTGLFENSKGMPYVVADYLLPVDGKTYNVPFTNDTSEYSIPFTASIVKSGSKEGGKYVAGEVKIEYTSLTKTDFYKHYGVLRFVVYDDDTNILLMEKVIDHRKADQKSSGWTFQTSKLPAYEAIFNTMYDDVNKGTPNWAWFIIYCSNAPPVNRP